MRNSSILLLLALTRLTASQQIWDIWQTTWDKSKLFTPVPVLSPITFSSPGPIGNADIVVDDNAEYQTILGFGATLTDSSALTLNNLKSKNSANYWNLLNFMFSPTDSAHAAGLNYLRIPIGASDFSLRGYSLDDESGDTYLSSFNTNKVPSNVFSVLRDIKSINIYTKLHIVPWSPPAWMKDSGSMNGGSLQSQYLTSYAIYLLKAVRGFQNQGFSVHAISIQNEPQNNNPTYPTCTMTPDMEGQIGSSLRSLLNSNGLSSVKIIGYEHNWDNAGTYAAQLMHSYGEAFAGVAFHCYAGSVSGQDIFYNEIPSKGIYLTECTGTVGSDWWSDIKWYMDNLWIGALEHHAQTGLMWNIALDGNGNPKLPGTNSCGGLGCRALVSISNDGTYVLNQEFYSMAQASKAIIPRDAGGPFGRRIGVSVGGSTGWGLRVGAYVTNRASASDYSRYALVVLNWDDSAATNWNPKSIRTTIEFRGLQATYTFPVGITTLWWYAPRTKSDAFLTAFTEGKPASMNSSTTPPISVKPSPAEGGPYAPNPINGALVKGYGQQLHTDVARPDELENSGM